MRKHFVLSMLTICFILFFAQSATIVSNSEINGITESDPINLRGSLRTGDLRSGGDVISAEIQSGVIIALFHKDVGSLLVTITDGVSNTIYEATINTSVQQQVLIPLSGLPSGIYTITFYNERGEMWGKFDK